MRPGEVLALMGPSGSGKTSLLSVISGRTPRAMRTSGSVTANGMRFTKAAKRRVGFVLQDDLLYEVCVGALVCVRASRAGLWGAHVGWRAVLYIRVRVAVERAE